MRATMGLSLVLSVAACSGTDEHVQPSDAAVPDAAVPDAAVPDAWPAYQVGGTALGVRGDVTLRLAAAGVEQTVAIGADGAFTFPDAVADGEPFVVTLDGAPPCVLAAASGTVAGANVTSVALTCDGVAELASVAFSIPVVLTPGFASAELTYDARWPLLADGLTTFTLTPVAMYASEVTITVAGESVASGAASSSLALDADPDAEAAVVVTHPWFTRTYTFDLAPGIGQEAYVKASTTAGGDYFGVSFDLEGDTLVVGRTGAHPGGAVHVFRRDGSTWVEESVLRPAESGEGDAFGISVALDGDWLVAGAFFEDGDGSGPEDDSLDQAGAAYVFRRTETGWVEEAYLKASNPDVGDWFGEFVAIDGDTIVVGARLEASAGTGVDGDQDDDSIEFAGAAYVFRRGDDGWHQEAYLKPPDTGDTGYEFGVSVAVSGDTVAVGAPRQGAWLVPDDGHSGAVYVFTRSGTQWTQEAFLKASDRELGDHLGWSVALDGDVLLAGALADAAYVFRRTSTWSEEAILPADGPWRVGLRGDWAGVTSGETVRVFQHRDGIWTQRAQLQASNHETGDFFGSHIAIDGHAIAVGAMHEASAATGIDGDQTDNSAPYAGAVYVFR